MCPARDSSAKASGIGTPIPDRVVADSRISGYHPRSGWDETPERAATTGLVAPVMSLVLVRHYCPACGYPGLDEPAYAGLPPGPPPVHPGPPPYKRWYGEPAYLVCPCCGFEPGNDDDPWSGHNTPLGFAEYRRRWIAEGGNWLDESQKPEGWDLRGQLRVAGIAEDA
jgi:hypothetical protein